MVHLINNRAVTAGIWVLGNVFAVSVIAVVATCSAVSFFLPKGKKD